jgi:hypothetical protein
MSGDCAFVRNFLLPTPTGFEATHDYKGKIITGQQKRAKSALMHKKIVLLHEARLR